MRQHLAIYTSVASKNAGVRRVKTPVETPLKAKFGKTEVKTCLMEVSKQPGF